MLANEKVVVEVAAAQAAAAIANSSKSIKAVEVAEAFVVVSLAVPLCCLPHPSKPVLLSDGICV